MQLKFFSRLHVFWVFLILFGSLFTQQARGEVNYAALSSITTQEPMGSGGTIVKMEVTDEIKNVGVSTTKDGVIIQKAGLYIVYAEGQLGATSPSAAGYMDIWFVKNGKPMADSNNRVYLSQDTPATLISTQFITYLNVGDTLGVAFSASGPSLGFVYFKPDNEPAATSFSFFTVKVGE